MLFQGDVQALSSSKGRYRIQTVAEMTGIPSATLRAWERRYGVPTPARSASAYRLYDDSDVAMVSKLRDLCSRGLAPAEAARITREGSAVKADGAPEVIGGPELIRGRLIDAIERFRPEELERAVIDTVSMGAAMWAFEEVIAPVLRVVGERWHSGQLSIAQEHLATEVLGGASRSLLRMVQPPEPEMTAVLACFADEDHVVPLYGVGMRLAGQSIRSVVLGARTPPEAVADAVQKLQPKLVCLSVTITPQMDHAHRLIAAYAAACGEVPWLVGGVGVAPLVGLIEQAGGLVARCGTTTRETVSMVRDRMRAARK